MNFNNILEIHKINKDELNGNKELTNDYLVEELLIELGYNRKIDKTVKKFNGNELDWITGDIGVYVYPCGKSINNEIENEAVQHCINAKVNTLVLTDGINIKVISIEENNRYSISLSSLSDTDYKVLEALSKEGYNRDVLAKARKSSIDRERFIEIVENGLDEIASVINIMANEVYDIDTIKDRLLESIRGESFITRDEFKEISSGNEDDIEEHEFSTGAFEDDFIDNEDEIIDEFDEETIEDFNEDNIGEPEEESEDFENTYEFDEDNDEFEETDGGSFEDDIEEFEDDIEISDEDFEESEDDTNEVSEYIDEDDIIGYKAVINGEELYSENLKEFTSRVIQMLYRIKSFKASEFIFNNEIIKLTEDGNDFVINGTKYDLDIEGVTSKDVIYALKEMYNNFDDIEYSMDIELEDVSLPLDEIDGIIGNKIATVRSNLDNINSILWNDNVVAIKSIEMVAGLNISDNSLNQCIIAILTTDTSAVSKISKAKLDDINSFIELGDTDVIFNTKYSVKDGLDLKQKFSVLIDISNYIDIALDSIIVYMDVETSDADSISEYIVDKSDTVINEVDDYDSTDDTEDKVILSAKEIKRVCGHKSANNIYSKIMGKCVAVKTKYMQTVIDSSDKFLDVVQRIMENGIDNGAPLDFKSIGNVVGEDYLLVSDNENDVSESHSEVLVGGDRIYVSDVESWQVPFEIIKLHTNLANDANIAVKNTYRVGALDYYSNKFITRNPEKALAVRGLTDCLLNSIR